MRSRRSYGSRQEGLLADLLTELLKHIQSGCTGLTGALHLRRLFPAAIEQQLGAVVAEQAGRKAELRGEFEGWVAFDPVKAQRLRVGIWCESVTDVPQVQGLRPSGQP